MKISKKHVEEINKKLVKEKIYDEYMPFTIEVEGHEYINNYLGIVVKYLDEHKDELASIAEKFYKENPYFTSVENRTEFPGISDEEYSAMRETQMRYYRELQGLLISDREAQNEEGISDRKGVNTFIKYGFVKPLMAGYRDEAVRLLNAASPEEKECIIGQVFYTYGSSFTSYSQNYFYIDTQKFEDIKLVFRSLYSSQKKYLSKADIVGLMITVPNSVSNKLNVRNMELIEKGFLTDEEMEQQYSLSKFINLLKTKVVPKSIKMFEDNFETIIQTGTIENYPYEIKLFEKRKYNQIGYLRRALAKYPGLELMRSNLMISSVFSEHFDYEKSEDKKRDPVKHRIYRDYLLKESQDIYHKIVCYADKIPWKALVASHLWAYSDCRDSGNEELAYDLYNGILLSPNIDAYFDKYNITFDNDGKILITSDRSIIPNEVREVIKDYCLDKEILTDSRRKYLEIHRKKFLEKESAR